MLLLPHFATFSWGGEEKENGVLISSCNNMAIFQKNILKNNDARRKELWLPAEKWNTLSYSERMAYFSTHANNNNVFLACLAQSQQFKSQSWFSDRSIRSGCVSLFLHVWQNIDASQTTDDLPQLSLKTKTNRSTTGSLLRLSFRRTRRAATNNLQLAQDAAACYSMMILIKTLIKFSVEVIN